MVSIKALTRQWAALIAPKTWVWRDNYSIGTANHLKVLLSEVLSAYSTDQQPLYGSLFVFNTQSNTRLGTDGYDNYQAPLDSNNKELYKRRMWVGGSLKYYCLPPIIGDVVTCVEKISSVRCLGLNAFISISRDFSKNGFLAISEQRTLLYTNALFQESVSKPLLKPDISVHSTNIRVTLSQLMRFNALSYNLHKIHYDPEYCHQEKFQTVVVSGPFLVLTMLYYFSSLYPQMRIKNFTYKNSEPCYINEDLCLRIAETKEGFSIAITGGGRLRCGGSVSLLEGKLGIAGQRSRADKSYNR